MTKTFKNEVPTQPDGNLDINLTGVPRGRYRVVAYQTGYQHNDVLTAYKHMGSPFYITEKQENELNSSSAGHPVKTMNIEINKGYWHIRLKLSQNDVYLLKLIKL